MKGFNVLLVLLSFITVELKEEEKKSGEKNNAYQIIYKQNIIDIISSKMKQ